MEGGRAWPSFEPGLWGSSRSTAHGA